MSFDLVANNTQRIAEHAAIYDDTLDGHGPTLDITWRQYGELIRLLDQAADTEKELGWKAKSFTDMTDLLVAKARESSKKHHPSNYSEGTPS